MQYTFNVGTYFGIPVRIHITFPLILLAFGIEAAARGGWEAGVRAVLLILAVFVCVVLHEFGHSLQVKRYGITVRDIVLLPIGGMARADRIPEEPWREIVVAISGPLVNFVLAAVFFAIMWVGAPSQAPLEVILSSDSFVANLFFINVVLGVFNLVPAFPMDGGRILRGLLAIKFPYLRATHYAKSVGQIIAVVFVVVGFMSTAFLMLPVIAVFIFFGAMSEEQMIRVKVLLEDRSMGDIAAEQRIFQLADPVVSVLQYDQPRRRTAVAVTDPTHTVTGAVAMNDVVGMVRAQRGGESLSSIVRFDFPVFLADMAAVNAYHFMQAEKKPYAGVMADGRFLGLVYLGEFLEEPR